MTRFVDPRALRGPGASFVAFAAAFVVTLRLAVGAVLPSAAVTVLAPLTLLGAAASLWVLRARVLGAPARLTRTTLGALGPGAWSFVLGTLLALPTLGAFGLIDPWESHYAEVAREMVERRDLVSPWWANEGWFRSKPVLLFWLEALSIRVFGVGTGPNQPLAGLFGAAHPEWAVRLPGLLFLLGGSWALVDAVARACGRRAAVFTAVVLWTMPGFAILSHQALTDAPLLGALAASLGFFIRALTAAPGAPVDALAFSWEVGPNPLFGRFGGRGRARSVLVHGGHLVAVLVAALVVPQIVALALQHVHLTAAGLVIGPDHVLAGSPHACGLPSQPICAPAPLAHPRITPIGQALLWTAPAAWLILHLAEETREDRLCAVAAWTFAALAAMAKGPVGLAVPAAALAFHLVEQRSLRPLRRLAIGTGLVVAVVTIAPWYLATYARHGRLFVDELVLKHMFGRALEHLHDTNEGEDVGIVYFVRQIAYATFPWTGVALAGVLGRRRSSGRGGADVSSAPRSRRDVARGALFGALVFAFILVSAMRTKFHHYGLIAIPPLAALTGLWLDEVVALARDPGASRRPRALWASATLFAAAVVTAVVAIDLAGRGRGPAHWILLVTYRYTREWTSAAEFRPIVAIAAAAAVVALLVATVPRWRLHALTGAFAIAIGLTAVVTDLIVPRAAVDGGQRGVIAAYEAARAREGERAARRPLVAYALNWKGENFYTGNDLAIFLSGGAPFASYLAARRSDGGPIYLVTERRRVASLQREAGAFTFTELTGPEISAEFALVRLDP